MRLPFTLRFLTSILTPILLATCVLPGFADTPVPSRVIEHVDDASLVRLTGNTQPSARPRNDRGLVNPAKQLERMMLVLKRSPEQEQALAAFNERQYDPKSPDFHHWLDATQFGQLYGPSDADIAQTTNWLQNHGFSIFRVSKGRVTIEFSGTVAQVQEAFHLEMHNYLVNGKMHMANDRDPSIPAALLPVITGIASLHDFFPTRTHRPNLYIKRDAKTGKYSRWKPENEVADDSTPATPSPDEPGYYLTANSKREPGAGGVHSDFVFQDPNVTTSNFPDQVLAPYDVATIYNILPLWKESTPINGTGVSVAIIAYSDVVVSDFNIFRSSFDLPASTLQMVHDGADPGVTKENQGENTLDVEMVSSTAPGAQVILVSNVSTATTDGLAIGINQVVENNLAPIMTMSYLSCELQLGTAGNSYWSQLFQQATTSGITPFTCSDDAGSAGCTSQDGTSPYGDSYGLAVSGMTSNPYVTSVGGSDLQWYLGDKPYDTYWNLTNDPTTSASAKGYMPEMAWNTSCTNPLLVGSPFFPDATSSEQICNNSITANPGLLSMGSGGGGVSACTTNNTNPSSGNALDPTSCSGGYAQPSWQTGVPGIPTGGNREVPDVVMFGSYGFGMNTGLPLSALLICQSDQLEAGVCNYTNGGDIVYEANGGTSAATPLTAGIMAMIVQKMNGAKQGLANRTLYSLAAKENYSSCNSNTVAPGNSCIFYDITTGSNAMNCYAGGPDCVTSTNGDQSGILSGYSAGVGYDMTTGLGSMNVANLVNAWAAEVDGASAITLSPSSLTFPTTPVGTTAATQTVKVENTGTAAVTITNISISGGNYSDFSGTGTTTNCPTTAALAAGTSCSVTIAFDPAAAGARSSTLVVTDNAGSGSQSATLSGTGGSAATTSATLTPGTETFPSTTVGVTSSTSPTVTLKNTGTTTLTINSLTLSGSGQNSFGASTTCGGTLAASASCTFTFTFAPQSAGTLTATFSVADTAGTQSVTLSGTGASATAPAISFTPTSVAFASTTVGSTSAATIITVKNTGTAAATLSSETLTGSSPSSFVISANNCPASLAAGSSCAVYVEFKPATATALAATLSVADNAAGSPQTVALSGTGTAATGGSTLTFTPASLGFASTAVGSETAAQEIVMKNTGTTAISFTSYKYTGANASSFVQTSSNCSTSLAAGSSCAFFVAFKPQSSGALSAALTATDNLANSPQSVPLSGTGTGGSALTVSVSPSSIAFGSLAVGSTSAAQSVTVTNTGTAAVTLSSETLTGSNPSSFVISANNCTATLAASASCTVSVEFKPASAAAFAATLSIADNATGTPQTVALSGTGVAGSSSTLTFTPASLSFASTAVGSETAAQEIVMKNTGTTAISFTSYKYTGANASSFVQTSSNCSTSLAAGSSCAFFVAFKPQSSGALSAALTATDNLASSPQSVPLSGTGTGGSAATVTLSPTSLAFPNTIVGSTSDAQIVTLTNTGSASTTITGITLAGASPSSYEELNNCGATLAASASCSIYVAFKPASAAALAATLSVADSATGSPQTVALSGTGTAAPSVKLSATSLAFGTIAHGTTSEAQAVTLTNSGTATLTLASITLGGTGAADFEAIDTCAATLAPSASCTVYVAFKPAAAAAYSATLSIADNGSASPQAVTLTGTGN